LLDAGFRRAYQPVEEAAAPVLAGQGRLAQLKKGEKVEPRWVSVRRQTSRKPVMTEAALIRAMQERGIGRPSTYAATVETLVERGYATRNERGELAVTERGRAVCAYLVEHFPDIFDYGFTARMETRLDDIAAGRATYEAVLTEFWDRLTGLVGERFPPARSRKARQP